MAVTDGIRPLLRHEIELLTEAEHRALHAELHRKAGEIRNLNDLEGEQLTIGQLYADTVAKQIDSRRFILIQAAILLARIVVNSVAWRHD